MSECEHIFYHGKKYAKNKAGYWVCTTDDHKGLHRVVWEFHHGAIPDGYEIHHIDGNKSNNAIENLQCLPRAEHRKLHNNRRRGVILERNNQSVCVQCGKIFLSAKKGSKFCSRKCKRSWLTEHGRFNDRVVRVCEHCGKEFETSKYDETRFCSLKCAKVEVVAATSKLKPSDVRYIRSNPDGLSYSELAKKFSVTKTSIYRVVHRLMYPNID